MTLLLYAEDSDFYLRTNLNHKIEIKLSKRSKQAQNAHSKTCFHKTQGREKTRRRSQASTHPLNEGSEHNLITIMNNKENTNNKNMSVY
jgi:hypothetical protein